MKRQLNQRMKSERGQSLMEMAFGMVILLLLVGGAVDLGRAFFTWMALKDAAQEGAAFASAVCPDNRGRIFDRVRNSSESPVDLWSSEVIVECTREDGSSCNDPATPGTWVNIRVTYVNFKVTMPFMGAIIGQTLTLTAEARDTILRNSGCPLSP